MLKLTFMTKIWILSLMKNKWFSLPMTLVYLVLAVIFFEWSDLDSLVQNYFYNAESLTWMIDRNEPILHFLLYSGIKKLFISVVLFLLFALIFLRKNAWVKHNVKGLVIVVLSCLVIPLTVGVLKGNTNMPCPNQLVEFGGQYDSIGLFETLDADSQRPITRCYPAGHASGGFALLSLLFLFRTKKSRNNALIGVMLLGWGTASYKMLIGDHFLSHTIVTMLLAWIIVLLINSWVSYIESRFFNK